MKLIASWPMIAAATMVSAVADMLLMTAAPQSGAKTISAPNASAKTASPMTMTNDDARMKLSEKNILFMNRLPRTERIIALPAFFAVN